MKRLACIVLLAVATGCGGTPAASIPAVAASATNGPLATLVSKKIKHVVIVVQENRTFDNLFYGFPGADYATYGYTHNGAKVALQPADLLAKNISNSWHSSVTAWNGGKMNGFDEVAVNGVAGGTYLYSYVKRSEIEPYWRLARDYVLADHMFPTMFGGSFTAHLDLIASSASLSPGLTEVDTPSNAPWGCDAPPGTVTSLLGEQRNEGVNAGPFPCFTQFRTLADTLDAAHVSWKYYVPAISTGDIGGLFWTEFDAIANVRHGPDWLRNVVSPPSTVLTDASHGKLPSVAWVIPYGYDSDHPGGPSIGPSWVASVVNAIGTGPDWDTTAIVVLWDDWGGWYDHVPPPQLDFRGLGIRVPCIIISPYVKAHTVTHTQYEFGSVVRLVEQVFGLPRLGSIGNGYTDARAKSMLDAFDFNQTPIPFKVIPAAKPASYFLTHNPTGDPPDDD